MEVILTVSKQLLIKIKLCHHFISNKVLSKIITFHRQLMENHQLLKINMLDKQALLILEIMLENEN